MRRFSFHKGHGTKNDFIILDDSYGMHDMHPQFIQVVCDRRSGIGADGVIRVVRAGSMREWQGEPSLWFMDYYNADGSVAEMCGNGLRVFARHLINEQLVESGSFDVATRAGVKHVEVARHGLISTDIGRATLVDEVVTVRHGDRTWPAVKVDVGTPTRSYSSSAGSSTSSSCITPPSGSPSRRTRRASTSSSSTSRPLGSCGCGCTSVGWGRR